MPQLKLNIFWIIMLLILCFFNLTFFLLSKASLRSLDLTIKILLLYEAFSFMRTFSSRVILYHIVLSLIALLMFVMKNQRWQYFLLFSFEQSFTWHGKHFSKGLQSCQKNILLCFFYITYQNALVWFWKVKIFTGLASFYENYLLEHLVKSHYFQYEYFRYTFLIPVVSLAKQASPLNSALTV